VLVLAAACRPLPSPRSARRHGAIDAAGDCISLAALFTHYAKATTGS
jgi:hypothetical protein